ncbi:MKK3 [Symbiodinium sp. CCMP2592]|nr:MKK3 [Symbiodinium sp. CCMP2592]
MALPTVAASMVQLDDLLAAAGANDSIKNYITARKITTTPTLALIAKDVERFTTHIIHPYITGIRIDGTDHKVEDGQDDVATAVMTHLFVEATRQWTAASSSPVPAPAALPAPAATPPSTATPAIPDRPPKTFSAWNQQVNIYEERSTSAASSKALRLEHGLLLQEEPTEWVPKGLFSTIDGANAARRPTS